VQHAKLSRPAFLTKSAVTEQCEWCQSVTCLEAVRKEPSHQKLLLQRFMASNPPFGVLFIFHSHYFFAIGHPKYLAFDVFYHQLVLKFQSARLSLGDFSTRRSTTRLSLSSTRFYIPLVEKWESSHLYYFTTPEGFDLGYSMFIRHY
jgi:hypothetical protein